MPRSSMILMLLLVPLWSSHASGHDRPIGADPPSVMVDGRPYIVRDQGLEPLATDVPFEPLLPSSGLDGWSIVGGGAGIERVGDEIHGRGSDSRNTFLISDGSYSDFVLEGEVRINKGGNSGWQVRSRRVDPDDDRAGVMGYQIEVDSSERAWSGGFYDEMRRGWIHSMRGEDASRGAFRTGEWNHYRIECRGPHVRSWVNGVPCADVIDFADAEGSIAFQVHSGRCEVRWRNLRIKELPAVEGRVTAGWKSDATTEDGWSIRHHDLPVGDVVIDTNIPVDRRTEIIVEDEDGSELVRIKADPGLEPETVAAPGRSGRFPVAGAGAGIETKDDDAPKRVVMDLEGGRLVVIVDGRIVVRSILSDDETPGRMVVRTYGRGDGTGREAGSGQRDHP